MAFHLRRKLSERRSALLLGTILLIALFLRLWGNDFGLPNLYHPDEDAVLMPAINIIKTGDLEPIRLEYGSLHIYLLTAVSAIVFSLSARSGNIAEVGQLPIFERGNYPAVYAHPEYFLASRTLSAVMGTGIVLLAYMLARRLQNERMGLITAAITALLPALVSDAHYATTDTPLMFWAILSLYLLIRTYENWESDTLWAYAGAGLICGLATATKYNGVMLIAPLIFVPLFRIQGLDDLLRLRAVVGPGAMAAGFLLGTPYALLNLPKFLQWFGYSLRLYNAPHEPLVAGWQWHLDYHLTSPHAVVFILALFGFILSFHQWGKRALILNSFPVLLWVAILSQTNLQARMWLPAAPVFMIWAALALETIISRLRTHLPSFRFKERLVYTPLLITIPLLITSIQYDRQFQADDVRTLAQRWIVEHVTPGSHIAVDYFPPALDPQVWPVTKTFRLYDHELNWFTEKGVNYLVMNESLNDFDSLPHDAYERYQALISAVCLVGRVNGPFIGTHYFDIKIYKMPPCEG